MLQKPVLSPLHPPLTEPLSSDSLPWADGGGGGLPSTAILTEDSQPLLTEDGQFLLTE